MLWRIFATLIKSFFKNVSDYHLFVEMTKWVAATLGMKIIKNPDGTWEILEGSMASGRKDTSHGDSWIFALVFFMYVCYYVRTKECGSELLRSVLTFMTGINVFGDDFVAWVELRFRHIINFKSFSAFIEKLGMRFKEGEDKFNFLTEIDEFDEVRKEGVKLLQVLFVHRDSVSDDVRLPLVLPYKKSDRLMCRSIYGNGEPRMILDYAVSAIGTVWASYGTNKRIYDFFKWFFEQIIFKSGTHDWVGEYFSTVKSRGVITNLLRKANISIDQLKKGFPTREELLKGNYEKQEEHLYYHDKNDFVI